MLEIGNGKFVHKPVLVQETLEHLNLKVGENMIDATLDGGGHAEMFLRAIAPNGKVLGIEQDEKIIRLFSSKFKIQNSKFWKNLIIAEGNFRDIAEVAKKHDFHPDAIFFDLGMSTWHLRESGRGFSFQKPGEVLDMRFSDHAKITAAEILNSYSQGKLAQIFKEYGEEGRAAVFAQKIVMHRKKKKIITVADLITALGTKHPKILARVFQSLRIFINDEINSLRSGISEAFSILKAGGRIAVISYHSLEDREVKHFFKQAQKEGQGKTFKKPIVPGNEEIRKNPSARSAKLRILWKI